MSRSAVMSTRWTPCHPSLRLIANELGMSRGQVVRQMGCLIHYGLVTREPRESRGRKTTSLYTLVDPERAPLRPCRQYLGAPPGTRRAGRAGYGRAAGAPTDSAPAIAIRMAAAPRYRMPARPGAPTNNTHRN